MTRKFFSYEDRIVPMHFPRLLVAVASKQVADSGSLLVGTEVTQEMLNSPDARICLRQYAALCGNAVRLTGNPSLSFDLGQRVQLANLGMLGLAAMSSYNVKTVLELGTRYYSLLAPFWDISLKVGEREARIIVREAVALGWVHSFATEVFLVSMMSLARALLGQNPSIIRVEIAHPSPNHAARYAEVTSAPVLFDQPETQIVFESALLQQELPGFDPVTVRAAERQCAAELSHVGTSGGLLSSVRRLLDASPGHYPTPEVLAHKLLTSERTLRRALTNMGSSYQTLLDIARCKHATELLVSTDMSINEIAEYLAFSEGRALRRAFKRWTGWTAAEYRRHKRAEMREQFGREAAEPGPAPSVELKLEHGVDEAEPLRVVAVGARTLAHAGVR